MFQVGRFCEFYTLLDEWVISLLHLKRLKPRQRGVLYGFPAHLAEEYLSKLLSSPFLPDGHSVIIIRETGRCYTRVKQRLPLLKICKTIIKKEDKNV